MSNKPPLQPGIDTPADTLGTLELPGSRSMRIQGYDVARGLAFIGMVLVNFKVVFDYTGGSIWGSLNKLFTEFNTGTLSNSLASICTGRASALFVLLAGVGISLMSRGAARKDPIRGLQKTRWIYIKRAAFLLVIGYAWQPLWEGDILHYYAFYLGVAACFLTVNSMTLWVLALLSVAIFGYIFGWLPYTDGWDLETLSHPEFWTWDGQLKNLLYNGWHPLFPWLAFVFIGLWVGRLDATRFVVQISLLLGGIIAMVIAWLLMWWLQPSASFFDGVAGYFNEAFWSLSSIPPGPLYILSATGSALVVIGLCLLVVPWLGWVATPLVRTGQMALTLYLAHVILGIAPFVGSNEEAAETTWSAASVLWWWIGFSLASVVFATLWLQWFRRGPLEVVMRKICG